MTTNKSMTVHIPTLPNAYTTEHLKNACLALGIEARYVRSIFLDAKEVRVRVLVMHPEHEHLAFADRGTLDVEITVPVVSKRETNP